MKIKKNALIKLIKEQRETSDFGPDYSTSGLVKKREPSPLAQNIRKSTGLNNMKQIGYLMSIMSHMANIMMVSPFNDSKFKRLLNVVDKNFPINE